MKTETLNGIPFLFFENLISYNLLFHAVSTRNGGASPQPFSSLNLGLYSGDTYENILSNHLAISRALSFDLQLLVTARQVHGKKNIYVTQKPSKKVPFLLKDAFDGYDALITDQQDVVLAVRVADCVPIILFDPAKTVLAVIHAGWKGTAAGITASTINKMGKIYGSEPSEIQAGIGPAIGSCCFSVQQEVAQVFYKGFHNAGLYVTKKKHDYYINLKEANRLQLIEQGCQPANIAVCDLCTSCNSDLFFSHRREQGKTGRFALLAGLRS